MASIGALTNLETLSKIKGVTKFDSNLDASFFTKLTYIVNICLVGIETLVFGELSRVLGNSPFLFD